MVGHVMSPGPAEMDVPMTPGGQVINPESVELDVPMIDGDMPAGTAPAFHVAIAGIGPAGLLLAHYLLRHGNGRFRVSMFDPREDPRIEAERPRSDRRYLLSLSLRGRVALSGIPGLLQVVEEGSLLGKTRHVYIGDAPPKIIPFSAPYPMYLDRVRLCAILLSHLLASHGDSGLLSVHFGERISTIDFKRHVAVVESTLAGMATDGTPSAPDSMGEVVAPGPGADLPEAGFRTSPGAHEVPFDLLVGADGVNSTVRMALAQQWDGIDVVMADAFWQGKILHANLPHLPRDSFIQAPAVPRAGGGRVAVFVLQDQDTHNVVVRWPRHEPPRQLLSLSQDQDVKEWFDARLPWLGITLDACRQFRERRLQHLRKVKCGDYHHSPGQVVLIGDAAHSTPPFVGQACNAALTDSAVLARLLLGAAVNPADRLGNGGSIGSGEDRAPPPVLPLLPELKSEEDRETFRAGLVADLGRRLQRFSALQVAEGHALVDLSCAHLPHDRELAGTDFFRNGLRAVLSPLLGQHLNPYADAYNKYREDVERVLASNARVEEAWRVAQAKAILEGDGPSPVDCDGAQGGRRF